MWVALSNWFSRAGSLAAQLVCLPLLSTLLTPKEFAAYAIAVSLMTWYQLCDMGFGNSTQNHVAEARARNEEIGTLVATACVLAAIVMVVALVLLGPLSYWLNTALLGPIGLPATNRPQLMLWLSGVMFVGYALGTIGQKMLYAMQKGIYANIISLVNSFAFLGLLWGVTRQVATEDRLLASVLAYTLPMGLTGVSTLVYLAVKYARWDVKVITVQFSKLRVRAWRFWIMAIFSTGVTNVDYLVMSRTLSADDIAAYNVLFRVFWAGMALYAGVLSAAWPVFSALGVHGDFASINRHIRLYLIAGFGALLLGVAIMAANLPTLLNWLAPGLHIQVTFITLALFATYIGLRIWSDTYAVALQALNDMNIFIIVAPIQAVITIIAEFTLSKIWGINGILMGLITSYILTAVWVLPWKFKQLSQHKLTDENSLL